MFGQFWTSLGPVGSSLHQKGVHGRPGSEVRNHVEKELQPPPTKWSLLGPFWIHFGIIVGIDFRIDFWHRFGTVFGRVWGPGWGPSLSPKGERMHVAWLLKTSVSQTRNGNFGG